MSDILFKFIHSLNDFFLLLLAAQCVNTERNSGEFVKQVYNIINQPPNDPEEEPLQVANCTLLGHIKYTFSSCWLVILKAVGSYFFK